jgi:hypothetical protein
VLTLLYLKLFLFDTLKRFKILTTFLLYLQNKRLNCKTRSALAFPINSITKRFVSSSLLSKIQHKGVDFFYLMLLQCYFLNKPIKLTPCLIITNILDKRSGTISFSGIRYHQFIFQNLILKF